MPATADRPRRLTDHGARRRALPLAALLACCPTAGCGDRESPPPPDAAVDDAARPSYDFTWIADAAVAPTPATLGATVDRDGVTFRVWAPHATAATVVGSFAAGEAAMTAEGEGLFATRVADAAPGTTYRFRLETPAGRLDRLDPWCRERQGSACVVVDPSAYAWKSRAFTRPARNATVLYEMHVGSYAVPTGETCGTFASAAADLGRLASLGVNAVEVMPVTDFGGNDNGWGYNPQLLLAPKPSYGTADELRAFVDAAHGLGIAVLLDIVVNHYDGWKRAPLYCYDGHCPGGWSGIYFFPPGDYASTPWGPRPDYTQPRVVALLLGAATTWLDEHRGDGFRWDSTSNIRALDGKGTTPGGRELLVEANRLAHARGALSIAEDLKGHSPLTADPASGGLGFDAQWDGFGWTITEVLVGANDNARDLGRVQDALRGTYNGDPFARLLFTETHDTVGNDGARLTSKIDPAHPTSWAARRRAMIGAALLLTAPGVPMLFQGQEMLATGTFTDPPAPLAAPTEAGARGTAFFRDLIRLRRNLDGGTGGLLEGGIDVFHRNDGAKVIAYRRFGASGEDVVVVANLKNQAYTRYDVGVPTAGPWRVRLNLDRKTYGADFGDGQQGSVSTLAQAKDGQPFTLPLRLAGYAVMVLSR